MSLASMHLSSPLGRLTLVANPTALVALLWEVERPGRVRLARHTPVLGHSVLAAASRQLAEYFAGTSLTFDVPLAPGGTPFQHSVWQALHAIPPGETCSYATLAARIGHPRAARAVGAANGRNPISILIPCHRLVGSAGSLTGFAGGLAAKQWLLDHERR